MAKHRTVIEDHTFWEQARLLQPAAKRLDEVIDGVVWLVANHAEACPVIQGKLRVAFTNPFPDAPAVRIFFSITDENTCTLHWIEYLPIKEEDEYL